MDLPSSALLKSARTEVRINCKIYGLYPPFLISTVRAWPEPSGLGKEHFFVYWELSHFTAWSSHIPLDGAVQKRLKAAEYPIAQAKPKLL